MFDLTLDDAAVRGGAYLCQVGPCVSCGSCCGLYNMRDLSRERLQGILAERTRRFAGVPRTIADIDAFERERIHLEGNDYPISNFHHCVFVGLIQDGCERIGCLLHPYATGNNGVDWRGMSYYGGAACKNYFCPTYDHLSTRYKKLVRSALQDWYEFGLIIPEHRLLQALLEELEERLGRELELPLSPAYTKALMPLLRLKLTWAFRTPDRPLAFNFFSTKATDRPDLVLAGSQTPRLAVILRELDTNPTKTDEATIHLHTVLDDTLNALFAIGLPD